MKEYRGLIESLIKDGYLKTPRLIEAFAAHDRMQFIPESLRSEAYDNRALPIGEGQTISQPLVVAFMLELLDIQAGDAVLEIGTGSGWKTALLATLVGESGKVISVERIESLHKEAAGRLSKLPEYPRMRLLHGDGALGVADAAPFDKITAAASANEIPTAWREQLKIGGRIVAPVGESIVVLNKIGKDEFEQKDYIGFNFVPLVRG